jgi:NADH:ubiquinone oxidoreductase subunit E
MTKSIGRNATRKIAAIEALIEAKKLVCHVYSLDNSFIATECDPEFAWSRWVARDYAQLLVDERGKYTIQIHSNCWYELIEVAG